ncbi:Mitochondrial tRNA-specific 2-thiouridylase 1, partial [Trichinella pseudospiralis]
LLSRFAVINMVERMLLSDAMGKVLSSAYRSALNIGVNRRAELLINRMKNGDCPPVTAPRYPSDEKRIQQLNEKYPEMASMIHSKNAQLDENLKKLSVTRSVSFVECSQSNSNRMLPRKTRFSEKQLKFGIVEPSPEKVPQGKIQLSRLLELMGEVRNSGADVQLLAEQYGLREFDLKQTIKYFGAFQEGTDEIYLPPLKLDELDSFGEKVETVDEYEAKLFHIRAQVEKNRAIVDQYPDENSNKQRLDRKNWYIFCFMFKSVACAVSGGIDSAVTAYLLKARGFDVIGVFMKNWDLNDEFGYCCSDKDLLDADKVCQHLKIPFHEVQFINEYWDEVFTNMLNGYVAGKTPNPDILCNRLIKFDQFFSYCMQKLKVDAVATGHYARSSFGQFLENFSPEKNAKLLRPTDKLKDQTYFLCQIPQASLRRTMFPLANWLKKDVRVMAERTGMGWLNAKKESYGICMIGKRNFKNFISEYVVSKKGCFVDVDSQKKLGEHEGIHLFTRGQRVKIPGGKCPYYVSKIDPVDSTIYVCCYNCHPSLYTSSVQTLQPYWIEGQEPQILKKSKNLRCDFKYQHVLRSTSCIVKKLPSQLGLQVELKHPVRAISAGQYAIFYNDQDECLGGAEIAGTNPSWPELCIAFLIKLQGFYYLLRVVCSVWAEAFYTSIIEIALAVSFMDVFIVNVSMLEEAKALKSMIGNQVNSIPYFAVGIGFITLLLNIGGYVAMSMEKTVRKEKKYFLIRLMNLSYSVFGFGLIMYGFFLIYVRVVQKLPFITQQRCFLINILLDFSLHLVTDVNLFTAVDRCLAVAVPKFYIHVFKPKLINLITVLIVIHTGVLTIVGYFYASDDLQLFCSFSTRTSRSYSSKVRIQTNILLFLTVLLYIFLIILIHRKVQLLKRNGTNISKARKEMNVRLLITLFMSIATYSVTIIVGSIIISLSLEEPNLIDSMLLSRYSLIAYFCGIFHFLLITISMGEFRKLLRRTYLRFAISRVSRVDAALSVQVQKPVKSVAEMLRLLHCVVDEWGNHISACANCFAALPSKGQGISTTVCIHWPESVNKIFPLIVIITWCNYCRPALQFAQVAPFLVYLIAFSESKTVAFMMNVE